MAMILSLANERKLKILLHNARQGIFDGYETPRAVRYIVSCTIDFDVPQGGVRAIWTRDTGHHTSGWFKNPDFERCLHLSLSFWTIFVKGVVPNETREPERGEVEQWVDLFFHDWKRYVWEESPKSEHGKHAGVRHFRVFCDEVWQPIMPRGEVYNREFTEKGWKSWSEQQAEPLPKRLQKLADE